MIRGCVMSDFIGGKIKQFLVDGSTAERTLFDQAIQCDFLLKEEFKLSRFSLIRMFENGLFVREKTRLRTIGSKRSIYIVYNGDRFNEITEKVNAIFKGETEHRDVYRSMHNDEKIVVKLDKKEGTYVDFWWNVNEDYFICFAKVNARHVRIVLNSMLKEKDQYQKNIIKDYNLDGNYINQLKLTRGQ